MEQKDLDQAIQGVVELKQKAQAAIDETKAAKQAAEEVKTQLGNIAENVKVIKDEQAEDREALKKHIITVKEFHESNQKLKSFNELLAEDIMSHEKDFMDMASGKSRGFAFQMKAVGDMTLGANFTGGTASLTNVRPGIQAQPSRKTHVRDLVPMGTLDAGATSVTIVRENGAGEGSIATVAEGATKPQFDLDLAEVNFLVETIAGWMRISRKMLRNVQGITSFLQARLLEKLLRVEDDQLLNGNGTSPNISGITDTGNFTAFGGAATIDVEQLVQSISQLEELDREATGILLRPSDYYAILMNKASGSGEYDLPLVTFTGNQLYLAGVPVYRSTAMTVDKFITGDWRMGAMLLMAEPPTIRFFEEDGTNVRENKITVRIEESIAFPIFGSDYFIYGDLGNVA